MWIVLQILLLILNLGLGFNNIANNINPYIIATYFFAAGFAGMGAIAMAPK